MSPLLDSSLTVSSGAGLTIIVPRNVQLTFLGECPKSPVVNFYAGSIGISVTSVRTRG
jgi:hypothetical protein